MHNRLIGTVLVIGGVTLALLAVRSGYRKEKATLGNGLVAGIGAACVGVGCGFLS